MEKQELSFKDVQARLEEPRFYTYHWILEVPQPLYQEVLKHYKGDIYSEEPAQEFVTQYLRSRGDQGIVGLVGLDRQEEKVILDAAVRYDSKIDASRASRDGSCLHEEPFHCSPPCGY